MGDPGEKTVPRMVKFRKQRFRFEHVIFKRFHIKRNKSFIFIISTSTRDADLSLFRPPFCFPVAADT
jgi:hypothetical protein